jgi:hypothetical protein
MMSACCHAPMRALCDLQSSVVFCLVKKEPRNLIADPAAHPFAARALPGG